MVTSLASNSPEILVLSHFLTDSSFYLDPIFTGIHQLHSKSPKHLNLFRFILPGPRLQDKSSTQSSDINKLYNLPVDATVALDEWTL
jgi:hypothetical protein